MAIDRLPTTTRHLPARLAFGPALRVQSDRRLVGLVREGNESAFEEIVRRYRRPLDRFASSIVGEDADDVTQDAFRKALEALRHAEADVELRPWLFRIVRNTALNDLRDRPPAAAELAEDLVAGGRSAAVEAEQRAELHDLTAQLRALPENQRAALVMRELEGMGHEEIAAALGISDGAARQAIARARAAIRSSFGALVPLPLLRVLASGADSVASSGTATGSGAIAAGAGGLGLGALKVGLATVVVAGTIGAGVAIERHGDGHAPAGPTKVAAAPDAKQPSGAPTTVDPSHPSTRFENSASSVAGAGAHAAARSSRHRDRHRAGDGERGDNGPRLVPVAQQTTVTAPEPGGRSEGSGDPGRSHHAGGHDGSGDGPSEDSHRGSGGNQGSGDDGGDHQGSDGGGGHGGSGDTGGSSGGESSGQESVGGRTSGSPSSGGDGPGDGSVETAAAQTSGFTDDGSSGGDDSQSTGDDGGSGAESGTSTEPSSQSMGEPLPSSGSEPSS